MRLLGYIRVSTEEQEEDGFSLANQEDKLRGYAALYGHEIIEIITEVESAKSLKRPELQRALAMLKAGVADGLLVYKLDRLTRNLADWQHLIDNYFSERKGRTLLSMSESIDTTTAVGRMMLNMIIMFAQWERETIGERTRDALRYKIKNRERCGKVRYGYILALDGVKLAPDANEQGVIDLMRSMRAAGNSLRQIAEHLNENHVPTKEGRPWNHTTIDGILGRKIA